MGVNKININNNDSNYAHSIFDISEYTGKTYDTLTDALADVPDGKQKGGMTVSFVSTSDNKYVQYLCNSQTFTTNIDYWEKTNLEEEVSQLGQEVNGRPQNRYLINCTNRAASALIELYLEGTDTNKDYIVKQFRRVDNNDYVEICEVVNDTPTVVAYIYDNTLTKGIKALSKESGHNVTGYIIKNMSSADTYSVTATLNLAIATNLDESPSIKEYLHKKQTDAALVNISGVANNAQETTDSIIPYIDGYRPLLKWTINSWMNSSGEVKKNAGDNNYYATFDYYPIEAGMRVFCHTRMSVDYAVAFYDENKAVIGTAYKGIDLKLVAPSGAKYARFSTYNSASLPIGDAYVEYNTSEEAIPIKKAFGGDTNVDIADGLSLDYKPSTLNIDYKYKGEVSRGKRYLAIGFDDFRTSDFSLIQPLFEKYCGHATFNRINNLENIDKAGKEKILKTIMGAHEVGDHMFLHLSYPFLNPLWDGQSYPTNAHFRSDVGDGKNAFGQNLTDTISIAALGISTTYGALTDAECQKIRAYYSVMFDTYSGLIEILDTLSNKYLGTTGQSLNSWDGTKYTGGIFTDCLTSANHEIWERILQVTQFYFKEYFGLNAKLRTWSLPGSRTYAQFSDGTYKYYDASHTILANDLGRFTSSLTGKSRSFTDCLSVFGYIGTHDAQYPSRNDGQSRPAMRFQLFMGAKYSKDNALAYPTNYSVDYLTPTLYPESFFSGTKSKASQMYDDLSIHGRPFRTMIEYIRNNTARGMIAGGLFDSVNDWSSGVFFENLLRYCKSAGIEVISKAEAYDICFNHSADEGNLIGNPRFLNTAAGFFTDSEDLPTSPDGYLRTNGSDGGCSVSIVDGLPVLTTTKNIEYVVFGVPIGVLKYSAKVKGSGRIQFYSVKNKASADLVGTGVDLLGTINVNSSELEEQSIDLVIPNNITTDYEQLCGGLGDKIMALRIVYSSGIDIQSPYLGH